MKKSGAGDENYRRDVYRYDNLNRPEVILAEKTYNELSQLSNRKVGNNLQSIDYTYNIRGWMTDINKDQMAVPNLDGKLFAYKIRYNERLGIINPDPSLFSGKDVEAKYNGNIAEVDWRTVENIGNNPSTTPKRYSYAYDKLNRLTAGYYQNPQNPGSKENTESIDYDLNGNITNLYRTSVIESGNTPTVIDKLVYTYENSNKSNRLAKIIDDAQNTTGYEGGGQTIGYDANGNMTSIPDKSTNIQYNYLNLPSTVNMLAGFPFDMEYLYRADGVKLKKKNTSTVTGYNTVTTTINNSDYLDGFQYNNKTSTTHGGGGPVDPPMEAMMMMAPQSRAMEMQAFNLVDLGGVEPIGMIKTPDLEFFPTAEGFYDYKKDQYIYQYKDHLGNTRVSFGRNSAGALEIIDVNDYYPFGMNHLKSGNSFFGASSYKNYKYNGKELQESGMYDYGARFYMADIGRWGVQDPLSEITLQSYSYADNNPIFYNDPTGMIAQQPEMHSTIYKHKRTGEEVNVNDGINETVLVNGYDFAKARIYANYYNKGGGITNLFDQNKDNKFDVNQGYIDFYYSTRYGDGFSFASLFDSGPDKRRMPTSDNDTMILLEMPDMSKGPLKSTLRNVEKQILKRNIKWLVKNDSKLLKLAEETFNGNDLLRKEANTLVQQLNAGNLNPGIGSKNIGKNIFEARSRGGARVYFRNGTDGVEILGYSHKGNQQQVINRILKTYK